MTKKNRDEKESQKKKSRKRITKKNHNEKQSQKKESRKTITKKRITKNNHEKESRKRITNERTKKFFFRYGHFGVSRDIQKEKNGSER